MSRKQCIRINPQEIRKALDYDPDTGLFYRRPSGKVTGCAQKLAKHHRHKYVCVTINNRKYLAHRLAWALMMDSDIPEGLEIDHVNGDGSDNRWCNIRATTPHQNKRNMRMYARNTSGCNGVRWHKQGKKWNARIFTNGHAKSLGMFEAFEEAVKARKEAERKLGFEHRHGSNDDR